MLKKVLESKLLRFGFSAVLIFLAFRKIDFLSLVGELKMVPWWFIVLMVIFYGLVGMIGAYRWSLLLFKKPGLKEVVNFTKASYVGGFYSLIFPTGVAGDLLKWLPLQKSYPELTSTKLLGSSLLDRVIGFTAFIIVAFVASLIGLITKVTYPIYLFWIFTGIFLGVMCFYLIVFSFDVESWINKIPLLNKLKDIISLLKNENKEQILKALGMAFVSEFAWITPIWLTSLVLHAGFSLLSVYIFVPMVALILVLPISIAGFGAREQLYLFFFSQLGIADVKILAVSTFSGVIGVVNYLIGGIFLLL